MDAVEYLKQLKRVCNSFESCKECRQSIYAGSICVLSDLKDEKMAVEFVEKWAKDHPAKTRQSEFLKLVPNAYTDADGNIRIYPCAVDEKFREEKCGHERDKTCTECTREYWTEEIK